ncbi:MAG: DUF454 family protein [Bdellovibrionota bacterium]
MRILFWAVGSISFVFGIAGILLPIIPGVPLLLFSLYCFSRASERFRVWVLSRPGMGAAIQKMEQKARLAFPSWLDVLLVAIALGFLLYFLLRWIWKG